MVNAGIKCDAWAAVDAFALAGGFATVSKITVQLKK